MKKILIVLFILVVLLTALSLFWKSKNADSQGITIIGNDKTETKISLSSYRSNLIETTRGDTIKCWSLTEILKVNHVVFDQIKNISLQSKDGGKITLQNSEISSSYLTEERKKNETYYRLIIPTDQFPQRWLKYINQIEID